MGDYKKGAIELGMGETAIKGENNCKHLTFLIRNALLHFNKTEVEKYWESIMGLHKKEVTKFQPVVLFSKKTSALYQKASEWCEFKCFSWKEKKS